MQSTAKSALLVEDVPEDAARVRGSLDGANAFSVEVAAHLSIAVRRLRAGGVGVVLLSLGLKACPGLAAVCQLTQEEPDVPVIALVPGANVSLGLRAIREGAEEYWLKGGSESPDILVRMVATALARHAVVAELRRLSAERLEARPVVTVRTSHAVGLETLRHGSPLNFQAMTQQYEALLDVAVNRRIHRSNEDVSHGLIELAESMRVMRGGPRDVIDLHAAGLRARTDQLGKAQAALYFEEGRLLAFELMGHLVAQYRSQVLTNRPPARAPEVTAASEGERTLR